MKLTIRSLGCLTAVAVTTGLGLGVLPASAQSQALAMLDGLAKGEWEVRERGSDTVRRICVRTGREFIQLRHRQGGCNRFVVEDAARQVTVQYTCTGNGYGRTNIRSETPSLVQIQSQGIAGSVPFEFKAEARRVGNCR